jgi:hypothetical protein
VDIVFADDRLIDRIAQSPWGPAERTRSTGGAHRRDAHRPAYSELATADPLTELFETWRDELAADPMPALPRLRPTLVPQVAQRPPKRRSMRPALAIAAAIAALLVGTATIGSKNAQEGTALWGITQVMWPDRVESVASAKTVEAKLQVAKSALEAGRSRDAQDALIAASVELGKVDPVDGQEDMTQRVRALWVTASDQAAVSTQSTSSSSSSAASSSGVPTTPGSALQSAVAPVPPILVSSTEAPAAQLAGGPVDAPAPTQQAVVPQQDVPATAAAVAPPVTEPVSDSPTPASSVPSSASEVPPPPVSSEAPPSDETTSLPPPEPVQSAEVPPPVSAGQSAPEQSPPAPTPLTQTPEPDPTIDTGTPAADSPSAPADPASNAAP